MALPCIASQESSSHVSLSWNPLLFQSLARLHQGMGLTFPPKGNRTDSHPESSRNGEVGRAENVLCGVAMDLSRNPENCGNSCENKQRRIVCFFERSCTGFPVLLICQGLGRGWWEPSHGQLPSPHPTDRCVILLKNPSTMFFIAVGTDACQSMHVKHLPSSLLFPPRCSTGPKWRPPELHHRQSI